MYDRIFSLRGLVGLVLLLALCSSSCASCQEDDKNQKVGDGWGITRDSGPDTGPHTCENGEPQDGTCAPTAPKGAPEDKCPSGEYAAADAFDGNGVCLPDISDWSCPKGWEKTPGFTNSSGSPGNVPDGLDQIDTCQPPSAPADCPAGKMPVIGKSKCVSHGMACPKGKWPAKTKILSQAPSFTRKLLYVDASANSNGKGTRKSPFKTIAKALEEARTGDIVALAKGTYREAVELKDQVALVGACVGKTTVEAPDQSEGKATIEITGSGGALVSDLTITGNRPGIWTWRLQTPSDVKNLRIEEAHFTGIVVAGVEVELSATNVYVRNTKPQVKARRFGRGIHVTGGAIAHLANTTVEHNRDGGLVVEVIDTEVDAQNLLVRDTKERIPRHRDEESVVAGIKVLGGAKLDASTTLVEKSTRYGILAEGNKTEATFSNLVLRETTKGPKGNGGWGIHVADKGYLQLSQAVFGPHSHSIFATGAGAKAEVRSSKLGGSKQEAAIAEGGASARFSSVIFPASADRALLARDEKTEAEIVDSVIPTRYADIAVTDPPDGWGPEVDAKARLQLTRTVVEGRGRVGLLATDDATVEATDLVMRGQNENKSTRGADVENASLKVSRGLIEGMTGSGIAAFSQGKLDLSDLVIRSSDNASMGDGWGVTVQRNAELSRLERAQISGCRDVGLHVGQKSKATISNTTIDSTTATNGKFGDGVLVRQNSTLHARTSVIRENARAGILATESKLDLGDVRISDNEFGIVNISESDVSTQHSSVDGKKDAQKTCGSSCMPLPPEPQPMFGLPGN